ncbi:MAG TPA: M48 family metallopeptidase [Fimbriiglobus sp.]|nr:M48 family metallopeptidase [Fimbriiglobus sp.]
MRACAAVCWLTVLTAGCGFVEAPPRPGEGPGGREQPLALSPQEELEVGRRAAREVMAEYRGRLLPDDDPDVRRVRGVVAKLARAAEIEPLQREINLKVRGYRYEWEAHVIRERQANAFCLPAGKMFVFTGILLVAADDGELAAVLAHEMAHALAHHGSERVARQQGGGNILSSLHYDRMQESEADHIGVFLLPFAGYDPDEAVEFWQRMMSRGGAGLPEFLSDHPSPGTRVRNLRRWAGQARAAKAAYDRGDITPPR